MLAAPSRDFGPRLSASRSRRRCSRGRTRSSSRLRQGHPMRFVRLVALVTLVAGSLGLLPAPFATAQPKTYRIGFLTTSGTGGEALRRTLLDGLRERGYVEGRNLEVLLRHGEGAIERLPAAAMDLVRAGPDVIVTGVNATTRAAVTATQTIPIVMVIGSDVEIGRASCRET